MGRGTAAILILLCLAVPAPAQEARKFDAKGAVSKEEQKQIDEAIHKGVAYLKTQLKDLESLTHQGKRADELVLWTFVHAGITETDPDFTRLLEKVTESPLQYTYNVSLQAMILEQVQRVKYQSRIAQCAQFLVDNQSKNGTWSYGEPTTYPKEVTTAGAAAKDVASGGGTAKKVDPSKPYPLREKPKVLHRIPVQKRRDGPAEGDHSNSQYAALGLRACFDAGIVLPEPVLRLAEKTWRDVQGQHGWGYKGSEPGYGSMTTGAAGSLVIYDYMLGQPWKDDKNVVEGIKWITDHFSVSENLQRAESPGWMLYYYLYALERLGVLYGTETFGAHAWYPEGARFLLKQERSDGSWFSPSSSIGNQVWDTCFAILFLRRATRPLIDVVSEDRYLRK